MSSHYAQAYMQYSHPGGPQQTFSTLPQASTSRIQLNNPPPSARWYQPGTVRCKKQGCPFAGSQKAVETHMMDRHLIYPPGWVHRKKKDDWDADPSLKGYASLICIQVLLCLISLSANRFQSRAPLSSSIHLKPSSNGLQKGRNGFRLLTRLRKNSRRCKKQLLAVSSLSLTNAFQTRRDGWTVNVCTFLEEGIRVDRVAVEVVAGCMLRGCEILERYRKQPPYKALVRL